MRKVVLGRTGELVSAISLGTWAFGGENMSGKFAVGWAGQSDNDSKSVLLKAWESGINHWDTADVYGEGRSEMIIGEAWGTIPRDDIFLATKVGWDKGSLSYWYAPEQMVKNMERSLNNLKVNHVDLMYLHHCNFGKKDEFLEGAIEQLLRFKEEGKTRFIGLSDWSASKIMRYINIVNPDVVQPLYNVYDIEYETSGLKDHITKNNLGVCFFSPIKHGILTGKYNSIPDFPKGDFRKSVKEFKDMEFIEKMKKNRKKIESKFPSFGEDAIMQSLLGAILYNNPTACVLLGQRNKTQAEIAGRLGEPITRKDCLWILSLYRN